MTSEQRQYLKSAIDAHRREALAEAGDRKFQNQAKKSNERMHPLLAVVGLVNLAVLMTLALMVEHLAS